MISFIVEVNNRLTFFKDVEQCDYLLMKFMTELFILLYSDGYRGEAPDYVMSRSDTRVKKFSF